MLNFSAVVEEIALPPLVVRKQQAVRLAAQIIIGSMLLGSIPSMVRVPQEEIAFTQALDYWSKPPLDQLDFMRDQTLILMAGIMAEQLFLPGLAISTQAKSDLENGKRLLLDLRTRLENFSLLNKLTPQSGVGVELKEIFPPEILDSVVIRQLYDNGNLASAMITAQRFLLENLKNNRDAMARLMTLFLKEDEVSGTQIQKELVSALGKTEGAEMASRLRITAFGTVESDPCKLLIVNKGFWGRLLGNISAPFRYALLRFSGHP